MGDLSLLFGQTHWKICLLEEGSRRFLGCTFLSLTAEANIADSNMDVFSSFSGNLFTVLVYYLGVDDIGSRMAGGNAVVCKLHWCHDCSVLFMCFPNVCWIVLCKKGSNFLLDRIICRLC